MNDHLGATAGLAILGDESHIDTRLMMVCGLYGHDRPARQYFTDLPRVCHNEQLATWMSVGPIYKLIQQLCAGEGLTRLQDEVRVKHLMSPIHIRRKPILQRDAEGAILVESAQNL